MREVGMKVGRGRLLCPVNKQDGLEPVKSLMDHHLRYVGYLPPPSLDHNREGTNDGATHCRTCINPLT